MGHNAIREVVIILLHDNQFGRTGKEVLDKLTKSEIRHVLISTDAGAGHNRQMWDLREFLVSAGKEPLIIHLKINQSNNFWARLAINNYARLQNYPKAMELSRRISSLPVFDGILDKAARELGQPDYLEEQLLENGIKKGENVIISTTHAVGAQSVAILGMKKEWGKLILGEFVPDPWRNKIDIKSMWAYDSLGENRHICIVHDKTTLEVVQKYRHGRTFLPWGTLSAPDEMFAELPENKDFSMIPVHIGVEFSGNEIPNYDKLILAFLNTITGMLINGKIKLTLDVMQHISTLRTIENWLKINNLQDSLNIQIIGGDNMMDAVIKRHEYVVGRTRFNKPDVVITKGGEVPLEDRGRTLVVGVYGVEHEKMDIDVAVKEKPGFVVNMIGAPVQMWWDEILKRLSKMPEGKPVVSEALLAMGKMLELIQP